MIRFYASAGKRFDEGIAYSIAKGCSRHGLNCEVLEVKDFIRVLDDTSLAFVVGVKGHSHRIFQSHLDAGRHAVFVDKGYTRLSGGDVGTLYLRWSLNSFQPLKQLRSRVWPDDRWVKLEIDVAEPKVGGDAVLYAGSSQKYNDWHSLGDATEYATKVLRRLTKHTPRTLIYRPKPSWNDAVPIDGSFFSGPDKRSYHEIERAHVVVTHGSNICVEALLKGVPAIVLGEAATWDLSSHGEVDVEAPYRPSRDEVYRLACGLAYWQWTLNELASGEAWQVLSEFLTPVSAG